MVGHPVFTAGRGQQGHFLFPDGHVEARLEGVAEQSPTQEEERSLAEPNPWGVQGQTVSSVGFCEGNRAPALVTTAQIKMCPAAWHAHRYRCACRGLGVPPGAPQLCAGDVTCTLASVLM